VLNVAPKMTVFFFKCAGASKNILTVYEMLNSI